MSATAQEASTGRRATALAASACVLLSATASRLTDSAQGFAMNALLGGNKQSNGHGGGSSNLVGQLASGLLGGGKQNHGGSSSGHGGGGSSGLVGQLASGLLGGGKQNHGNSQSGHASSSGGGLGGLLGGVLGGGSVRRRPLL